MVRGPVTPYVRAAVTVSISQHLCRCPTLTHSRIFSCKYKYKSISVAGRRNMVDDNIAERSGGLRSCCILLTQLLNRRRSRHCSTFAKTSGDVGSPPVYLRRCSHASFARILYLPWTLDVRSCFQPATCGPATSGMKLAHLLYPVFQHWFKVDV